ncbi:MAG: glycosyltransferase family 4 protein [Thermoplasmata archaeon]
MTIPDFAKRWASEGLKGRSESSTGIDRKRGWWESTKNSNYSIRILLVYRSYSSFVKNDYDVLAKHFSVERFHWRGKRDLPGLVRAVKNSDITLSWFASDHAAVTVFFSRLFGKPSFVVVGGGDVAGVPEMGYGAFAQSRLKQGLSRYSLENADMLFPVSDFTKDEIFERAKPKRTEVIYNGIDIETFKPARDKENLIATISRVTEQAVALKGLETFVRASMHFPDFEFVIIGETERPAVDELKQMNPDIIATGHIDHTEIIEWLQRALVYCQLSYREAFGMGVAEAMACGCIPVVTARGALPEVVGNSGFHVPYGDEKATAEAIRRALESPERVGMKARQRIVEMFSMRRREQQLVRAISEIAGAYGLELLL